MSFQNAIENFQCSESGTDSFKALYRTLLGLMKTDADNAAAYYILATAAYNYVLRYEDQAVSTETADSSKTALLSLCKRYADVMGGSAELKLAAAAAIANEYEWQITKF